MKEAIEKNDGIGCIHFKNFEAVFPNNREKCFNTNKFIDCKKGKCLSYAKGKSAELLKMMQDLEVPTTLVEKFMICQMIKWQFSILILVHILRFTKFNLLKDTNEEKMKKIPFPFYKNSIRKLKACHKSKSINEYKNDQDITQKCGTDLNNYFKEQKIKPYYKYKNLRQFQYFFLILICIFSRKKQYIFHLFFLTLIYFSYQLVLIDM